MGTSKSYPGPTGSNPLIPPWAEDPSVPELDDEAGNSNEAAAHDEDVADEHVPTPQLGTWTSSKSGMTSLARRPSRAGYSRVGRRFVRSLGGSRGAARTSTAGRSAAGGLVQFLSSAALAGGTEAARTLGLEGYVGGAAKVLLAALANALAPPGRLLEESVARSAMVRTLAELFEEFAVGEAGLDGLSRMDSEDIESVLTTYISHYITERLLQNLFERAEQNAETAERAYSIEQDLRGFVEQVVILRFGNLDVFQVDWEGDEGAQVIEELFEQGYRVLEAAV